MHSNRVTQVEFRDATTLVSASKDGTTRFWDVGSGAEQGQDAHEYDVKNPARPAF